MVFTGTNPLDDVILAVEPDPFSIKAFNTPVLGFTLNSNPILEPPPPVPHIP